MAADFIRRFSEFWRSPAPERLNMLLAAERSFSDVFALVSGMTAEVHRWGATSDGVLIEFTVRGTAGGAPISWPSVDRFVLNEEGLATERFTYFDSLPLALTVVRRPKTWRGFIRGRIRQLRREDDRPL